ncbi:carotenoid biosynthesis protein [Mucilaginibacter lacusdianchii]|uniref:carotenoid biosynthesis protein n=1 Tax=Mucilaginibacter lacusdianchii TaxID=2684211 RepID=UPI00131CC58A|nr:carotenoid biosynthesis protein [Mucilaginibacter sp. JXJ CY 39]
MSKVKVSIIIIILFHAVGLMGFLVPAFRPLFLQLVPFHLLLMLIVVMANHYRMSERFLLFVLFVFVTGIVAEWIGVHKHWIFGDYAYGKTLGTKVFDIPLMIGVNWFVLVYATGVSLQRSRMINKTARVLIGAGMLVVLDLLIEPVAIRFDYWHWANNVIPLKNYLSWFGLSAVFLVVFEQFKFKTQNMVAPILLLVQFVFFALLQWT